MHSALRLAATLALAVGAVLAAPTYVEAGFSFDSAPGRLPKDVIPLDYRIALVPDLQQRTLAGRETVVLSVRRATSRLQFNTLNETLRDVQVDGGAPARLVTDNARQLTTLSLARPLPPGRHTLALAYSATIEAAPQGLFAQQYRDSTGRLGVMLSTQFEATDARRMFPCWDEPAFRATYQLSVTLPKEWAAVSNMPLASRVVSGTSAVFTFRRTPKMSSYLLELSAGDLRHLTAVSGGVQHGVWTVRGRQEQGRYALANSQQILADYDSYFGLGYPLPKLDSIAVPGGFGGAMENWGAITYNERILLLSADAPPRARTTIFSVQAHEMAHQWFGDLVTAAWWDDIWLNESFASWMATKETALRNPSWEWLEGADESKEAAMNADARLVSHPIQQHVENELEAEAAFDSEITYDKGEAILRMLESYVGPDTFRDAMRRYIRRHAYSNAASADLWDALGATSGKDIAAIARAWTEQAGFPLVSVTASCDASGNRTVTFAQHRFLLRPSDAHLTERWAIPIMLRSGAEATAEPVLLRDEGQTAAAGRCGDPLSANAGGTGFYRVAYDADTTAANIAAFPALPDADKIALLDDRWALAKAGGEPLSDYMALAAKLGNDLDARAWQQVSDALATLEHDMQGSAHYDEFTAYARALMLPAYLALGWAAKP
ncbi:MAG: M1 family metallopeptidase, partial [Candidatus Eremiobacteraeota bacterium]|nr:M1 family metallopeptidase [Candidatus Eremiobacteraeota bacterium]